MNNPQITLLKEQLLDSNVDFNQKTGEFIKIFNADSSDSGLPSGKWNISNDEWQRYEFLGDRVLNLVVADYLYPGAPSKREGEMTKMMGVVSNESLTGFIGRKSIDITLLIPRTIGQQQTYGEKIKGGSFEAFIGALYEIVGFEVTRTVVLNILSEEIEQYDPANYIGRLQESHQQSGLTVPVYAEMTEKRDGPAHSPRFTYRVAAGDGPSLAREPEETRRKQNRLQQRWLWINYPKIL